MQVSWTMGTDLGLVGATVLSSLRDSSVTIEFRGLWLLLWSWVYTNFRTSDCLVGSVSGQTIRSCVLQ